MNWLEIATIESKPRELNEIRSIPFSSLLTCADEPKQLHSNVGFTMKIMVLQSTHSINMDDFRNRRMEVKVKVGVVLGLSNQQSSPLLSRHKHLQIIRMFQFHLQVLLEMLSHHHHLHLNLSSMTHDWSNSHQLRNCSQNQQKKHCHWPRNWTLKFQIFHLVSILILIWDSDDFLRREHH